MSGAGNECPGEGGARSQGKSERVESLEPADGDSPAMAQLLIGTFPGASRATGLSPTKLHTPLKLPGEVLHTDLCPRNMGQR